jgi:SPP1 family predicted phage head-tail adaptor
MAKPGRYDKRMILYRPVLGTPSSSGEQLVTGEEVARMWCSIEHTGGSERKTADQVGATTSVTIRTWYRSDVVIDSTMWLMLADRKFEIESVEDVNEAHREFEISAHENG